MFNHIGSRVQCFELQGRDNYRITDRTEGDRQGITFSYIHYDNIPPPTLVFDVGPQYPYCYIIITFFFFWIYFYATDFVWLKFSDLTNGKLKIFMVAGKAGNLYYPGNSKSVTRKFSLTIVSTFCSFICYLY